MNKIGFLRRSSFFISPKENRFYSSPKDYNHTVLLPKTRFPLRVDATTREPEVMARGGTSLLYDWQLKHNRGSLWVTHDGPPYANGSLHIGHALNKILKDIVNRYAILQGRRVHFVPGFDCHGLPIEMKAMQQQQQSKAKKSSAASTSSSSSSSTSPSTSTSDDSGEKNGSGGSSADARALQIRQQAARFALDNVVGQSNDFMRWGVLGDWKRPYLTLHPQYEAMQIRVFYSMLRNGYIYRGAKPVYWSPSSRTALAEAELEYRDDHVSTSAYVALDVTNRGAALAAALAGKSAPVRLVVWTTTPWTLPANEAVCVSGSIEYAVVEGIDANALLLLAASRLEAFCAALQVQPSNGLRVVATLRGDQLLDVRYRHPTRSAATSTSKRARECAVFAAPHVADDSGSGLVHTAPGHGFEDFVICSQHGIAPYCPVDGTGRYDESVDDRTLAGADVLDGTANEAVLDMLRSAGLLLKASPFVHRYPYDWRTARPVILRATPQWFTRLTTLRDKAREMLNTVEIVPAAGRTRFDSMLASRDDWCISRQRVWGVPIPVLYRLAAPSASPNASSSSSTDEWHQFEGRLPGQPLMTDESVAHIQSLFAQHGSDCWWTLSVSELLPPSLRHEAANYRRGDDTMDVWFDSGTSWAGVLETRGVDDAIADIVIEGSDQHRGWFQSLLLTSVAARQIAPYRRIVTHGFVLDERGRKMAKSLGNVVEPRAVIENGNGADLLRLWCASVDYRGDVGIGRDVLNDTSAILKRIRNTLRFLLANVGDFDASRDLVPLGMYTVSPYERTRDSFVVCLIDVCAESMSPIDRYALHRTAVTVQAAARAYETFDYSAVSRAVQHFTSVDMSSFYLDAIKDRLYTDAQRSLPRRAAQSVCHLALEALMKMLAPLIPHTIEEVYQHSIGIDQLAPPSNNEEAVLRSVFQTGWPDVSSWLLDDKIANDWYTVMTDDWFLILNPIFSAQRNELLVIRSTVNLALEQHRAKKLIGKSLEADIDINARQDSATRTTRRLLGTNYDLF